MGELQQEQSKGPRPAKPNQFWIRVSLAFLLIFSAINIYVTIFALPKFDQIFRDASPPDLSLPALTQFVLISRTPLTIVAIIWPLIGIIIARRQKTGAVLRLNIALISTFLQIVITFWALYLAMMEIGGIIVGASNYRP